MKKTNSRVTFKKVCTGNFDVLLDGNKTGFCIINGSAGVSGTGFNMYGITKPNLTVRWIGSLQTCKALMSQKKEWQ